MAIKSNTTGKRKSTAAAKSRAFAPAKKQKLEGQKEKKTKVVDEAWIEEDENESDGGVPLDEDFDDMKIDEHPQKAFKASKNNGQDNSGKSPTTDSYASS